MSISSGAIAWEALEEIRRDIDDFLRDSVTAASSEGKRKAATGRLGSTDNSELHRLQREVEQLKLALGETHGGEGGGGGGGGAGGELALLRKRPRGRSEDAGYQVDEDEKDLIIRRLTQQLEEERLHRAHDAERHKVKMEELERNNDKMLRQVKFLTQEEEAARQELKEKNAKNLQDKQQLDEELRQTRRERDQMHSDLTQARSELGMMRRSAERLTYKQAEVQKSQELVRKLEEELGRCEGLLKAKTALELEVESLKFRLGEETQRRQQLEEAEAKRPDNNDLLKALQAKVQEQERVLKRRAAEMENLRTERANSSLLQERIQELEEARDRLERKLMGMAEMESKYESMVTEKRLMDKQFEAILKDRPEGEGEVTANRVLRLVRNLQNEQAQVWSRLGDSEARCATLTKELVEAKQRAQKEAEVGSSMEDRKFVLEEQMRVSETRIKVVERENASLKRLLDMFGTSSLAGSAQGGGGALGTGIRTSSAAPSSSSSSEGGEGVSVSESRVADLEQQLEQARKDLANAQSTVGGLASPNVLHKSRRRVSELESQVCELEAETERLRQKIERLEHQLQQKAAKATTTTTTTTTTRGEAGGEVDVDPKTTRVLHFTNNPSTLALREEVTTLRAENESLKAQLGSQGGGEGGTALAGVDTSSSSSTGGSLLVDRNVYGQRLREMFQERVKLFRDAVYQLTGYMATLKTEREFPQVQLRSMYAEDEDDFLLFQWTDGELQLVETPYTRKINRSLFAYLEKCNSYPAFLSSITLDLFGKQTMC